MKPRLAATSLSFSFILFGIGSNEDIYVEAAASCSLTTLYFSVLTAAAASLVLASIQMRVASHVVVGVCTFDVDVTRPATARLLNTYTCWIPPLKNGGDAATAAAVATSLLCCTESNRRRRRRRRRGIAFCFDVRGGLHCTVCTGVLIKTLYCLLQHFCKLSISTVGRLVRFRVDVSRT